MKTNKNKLEKRLYFLTMYNLSQIQIGIQSLHAAIEYSLKYGKNKEYLSWAKTHKTVILLNGGTSNDGMLSNKAFAPTLGSMEQHFQTLKKNKIKCVAFKEPDLNYSMSAIAFLVDERVFNKKDYPDFSYTEKDYEKLTKKSYSSLLHHDFEREKNLAYKNYVKSVGKDISFLKEFLKPMKFA